jgi:uronate dehydrogenase
MPKVLMTGAAGMMGRFLRAGLPGLGWQVRAFDTQDRDDIDAHEWIVGDIRDPAALDAAFDGVDAVVHLAGLSLEAPFADIMSANIDGTYQVFEAARRAGVKRFVYPSSNHAVGCTPRSGELRVDTRIRPDTYYGASKAFGEALGSLYADRAGMEVAVIRVGNCFPKPRTVRMLAHWLSPGDAVRLVHACLTAPGLHYEIVYGVSANTRRWFDLEPARKLGYEPQDDAEVFADELIAKFGSPAPDSPDETTPGGNWTRLPLGSREQWKSR